MFNLNAFHNIKKGDWLVILLSLASVAILFKTQWDSAPANKVQIRAADTIIGTYSLNQLRDIHVHGPLGDSVIRIQHGQARFIASPCQSQYCVHQGWLKRAGQAAICLPNHVSLELLGEKKLYDSLNY